MTMAQALRSKPFIVLALAFFACCAAHSGPIFHTVSYAVGCGLSVTAAVTIYSMEGAAGLGGFYAVAFVFGLAYGGTMPLYASLAREAFPPRILGGVIGAMTMLSGLGMALGPLLGGWLFDRYGSYAWMYLGSLMLGLAAAAVVTRFPRSPSRAREAQAGGDGVPAA